MIFDGLTEIIRFYGGLGKPLSSWELAVLAQEEKEREIMQEPRDHTAGLAAMADNPEVVPTEKMHHLLVALRGSQDEAARRAAPFKAVIKDEEEKMAGALAIVDAQGREIKAAIEDCLETEFALEDWKYKGKAGSAQIVRPKNRITYDVKGLETLRLSSDETNRLLGHLRREKKVSPYLKVQVK